MKKRILVVDDEENIRLLYEEELRDEGYEVQSTDNPDRVLDFIREKSVDLLILDIKMPQMNGLELMTKIRVLNEKIPVVISTAFGDFKRDFASWGSDAFLTKSGDLGELRETIERLLEESSD